MDAIETNFAQYLSDVEREFKFLRAGDIVEAATIDAHYAVNVRAPMLLSVLLARAGRPGRIVNLTSGQFLGPMPGELAYTASKGALETFGRPQRPWPESPEGFHVKAGCSENVQACGERSAGARVSP